jgi:hypothetical protein
VYFHTSPYPAGEIGGAGVILPSVFTARDGTGLVDFISGNPRPSGPYAAQPASDIRIPDTVGYHYVVAQTTGKDGAIVRDSVIILWSGVAQISAIAPNTFNILNGQSQLFTFRVSDQYGHPLAAGTTIKVSATVPPPTDPNSPVNQVQLGFGVDGTLVFPDVIVGYTNFSFLLSDGSTNIDQATPVTLRVSVTGPNVPGEGTLVTFINGTVH